MNGSVRSAAGLVWRHQRLVWWVFAVNMVLAWLSSLSVRATLRAVLDHSMESAKLVSGFDVGTLLLLKRITGFGADTVETALERPEVAMHSLYPSAAGAAVVFLVYLLFIDGGVVAVFLDDRKLSGAEFFEHSCLYFWRMAWLALYSALPLGLLLAIKESLSIYAGTLAGNSPQERLGFFVNVAVALALVAAALFVRLWFDVAQALVVRNNESRVLRVLTQSFGLALRSGKLFANYLGIGLFAAATFGVGIGVWVYLPHSSMGASFAVLELVTLSQIASRIWLKAASARWVGMGAGELASASGTGGRMPVIEATDVGSPLSEQT